MMRCLTVLLIAGLVSHAAADCVLDVQQGSLRGQTWTSLHGLDFCSYQGIPYAAPPVGDLRFRAPEPASAWEGELNATEAGNICVQSVLGVYLGYEDCLYLNVFTPQTGDAITELLPVLVFIHGGAYILGSGDPVSYGPHYFIDKDILVVTINYRLGILGFLGTGDDASPGNYALKDQVQALRWIQDNIESFGGDASQVTIMGESAGAWSVHYQVLSPLSTGLFRGGIANSGSVLMPLAFQSNPLDIAKGTAEAVGCPTDTTDSMMDCMRALDIDVLMGASDPVESGPTLRLPGIATDLYNLVWVPCVEVESEANPNPFLLDTPRNVIKSGNYNKVPVLAGTNEQEGALFIIFNIGTQAALDDLNSNFDQMSIPFFLDRSFEEDEIPDALNKIADFYLGTNHTVTPSNVNFLIDAATDRFMEYNIQKSWQLHLESGHDSIYIYNFGYRGRYSLLTKARYATGEYDLGVLHVDELEYLLSSGLRTDKWEEGHPDLEVVDAATTLWTNFVKFGNPTPEGGDIPQGVVWPKASSDSGELSIFVFDNDQSSDNPVDGILPLKLSVEVGKFKDRMDFWDSLNLAENRD